MLLTLAGAGAGAGVGAGAGAGAEEGERAGERAGAAVGSGAGAGAGEGAVTSVHWYWPCEGKSADVCEVKLDCEVVELVGEKGWGSALISVRGPPGLR